MRVCTDGTGDGMVRVYKNPSSVLVCTILAQCLNSVKGWRPEHGYLDGRVNRGKAKERPHFQLLRSAP